MPYCSGEMLRLKVRSTQIRKRGLSSNDRTSVRIRSFAGHGRHGMKGHFRQFHRSTGSGLDWRDVLRAGTGGRLNRSTETSPVVTSMGNSPRDGWESSAGQALGSASTTLCKSASISAAGETTAASPASANASATLWAFERKCNQNQTVV